MASMGVAAAGGGSTDHFLALFQSSPAGQVLLDLDGRILAVNPALCAMLGREEASLLGADLADLTPGEEVELYQRRLAAIVAGEVTSSTAHRSLLHRDGRRILVVLNATVLHDADGRPWRVVASAVDAAPQATVLEALRDAEQRFRALVENGFDLVAVVDASGTFRYLSPSITRSLGPHPDWAVGRPAMAAVHPDDREVVRAAFHSVLDDPTARPTFEYRVRWAGGGWRTVRASAANVFDRGGLEGVVFNALDVTEHRRAELALDHLTSHDALTGLLNRAGLVDRVANMLHAPDGGQHSRISLLSMDLDRFGLVNESFGHAVGDAVLMEVGERLRQAVLPHDLLARLGGDEFAVCCPGADEDEVLEVAERVQAALHEPVEVDGERLHISASIGITHDVGSDGLDDLLRDADAAVSFAKERGRGRLEVFDASLHERARYRVGIEQSLREALATDGLDVHYQVQVDLSTAAVVGVEALVRWEHPTWGWLLPADFIPIAEESGLVCEVTAWVLRRACTDLARLPGHVSVNLSARDLDDPRLVGRIESTLHDTGADPSRLWIEITESVLMSDAARNAEVLERLRALGLAVSVDDFGTGYSSLAYLRRLPVDQLKVDRSFVDGLGTEPEDSAVVEAIVSLAHTLDMDVVAEGVETVEQEQALLELGCDLAQGYLYARPVPLAEVPHTVGRCAGRARAGVSPASPSM